MMLGWFTDAVDDANVTVSMTSTEDEGTVLTDFSYVDVQIGISGVEIDTSYSGEIYLIILELIGVLFSYEMKLPDLTIGCVPHILGWTNLIFGAKSAV